MEDGSKQAIDQSAHTLGSKSAEAVRLEAMQKALEQFRNFEIKSVDVTGADDSIKSAILRYWRFDLDDLIANGKPIATKTLKGGIEHGGITSDLITPRIPYFLVVLNFTDRVSYDNRRPVSVFFLAI